MTEDRDVEVTHELSSFVTELRRLADTLEQGKAFTISIEGEEVTIPEGALFSVAHEREDGEVELEFQITWSMSDSDDEEEEDGEEEDEEEEEEEEEEAKGEPLSA